MINVLYVCTDWYETEGSTASLVNLIHSTHGRVHPIVLLNGHGKVETQLADQGVETIVAPFFYLWEKPKRLLTAVRHPSRTTWFRRLTLNNRCCRQVKQQLGDRKIDIVHSNTSVADVGAALAKTLHAKHVWHIRESLQQLNIHPYGGMKRLKRRINQADLRIVISHALLEQWKLNSENTVVLHDAVVRELPEPSHEARQKQILFCAAELNDFKGAPLAVEAFCKSKLVDCQLVMIGNYTESYHNKLIAIAEAYGMSDHLHFLGYRSDIEAYYRSAAAFLMCSKFEGLGRVTLEAMAYGCPVLALATGGTTDFVHHGQTGWLFHTMEECAATLQQVVQSDVSEVVQAARQLIADEYTESTYGQQIISLYQSLMSSCHASLS